MDKGRRNNKVNQFFLERLTSIIKKEMASGSVSLEAIASQMYITRGQLTRRVKAIKGMTTQQYAMKVRLTHASNLLKNNIDMAISEVAFRCGFEDATSFSRAFRRKYGISPSEYRNDDNLIDI
ncbi:MAG: helix-turn-helix transcriptional regulator [Muribaculaceae bacterium]|nr:helix-turn-helix transcriptional regulator [Muribaculaceae bacterium]